MTWVLDASVVVKALAGEEGAREAMALMREPIVAPDLLIAECLNALRKKVLRGELSKADALLAAGLLQASGIVLEPTQPLARRALELSLRLSHPSYDCIYVALAEKLDAVLVTADRKLVARCQQVDARDLSHRIRWLYDPAPPQVQERTFRPYMVRRAA